MQVEDYSQNRLYITSAQRWALNGIDLTSGSHFQVCIDGYWINVVLEHEASGYYVVPETIRLVEGLQARFINE